MRPPVLWADTIVEQIRHRLTTELKTTSQQHFSDGFDNGMEQILQTRWEQILFRPEFNLRARQTLL
jgi:hypothetical protein